MWQALAIVACVFLAGVITGALGAALAYHIPIKW